MIFSWTLVNKWRIAWLIEFSGGQPEHRLPLPYGT